MSNMFKYRITYLAGKLDTSICPPAIVSVLFPAFAGEPVELSESECIITFPTEQTPVDLGPLVRVQLLQNN